MRTSLSLTAKIVLLVSSMGMAFVAIMGYASWHIQRVESQYHVLLGQQAEAGHEAGMLRQYLGEASALVHAALITSAEDDSFAAKAQLLELQRGFQRSVRKLSEQVSGDGLVLDQVDTQSELFFALGQRAIDIHLQWRNGHALRMLASEITPTQERLYRAVDTLAHQTHGYFEQSVQTLITQTSQALQRTQWLGLLGVLLISFYAAWVGWRDISRPLLQLTRKMQHMGLQQYDTPLKGQERRDEIGSMVRTLQSLAAQLQQAHHLEQELLAQQQKNLLVEQLQNLTSALPGAVFQLHLAASGRWSLRFVSPQWVQLLGLEAEASSSVQAATQYLGQQDRQLMAGAKRHFLASARTLMPVDFDVALQVTDGVTRWIKTRANPHLEPDGSMVFNGVWLDVTKEVMQAKALSKAKRQAEQSATQRTALQAMISHEIRTPLNAILGLTQLLLKAELAAPQRDQLQHIFRAGQHLRGIVNEVLDFSKIDAGQLKLESTDFSLQTVVHDVLGMCQEAADSKGLQLHCHIAHTVPDALRGDPHRIAQILLNYVNNAIKFTEAGQVQLSLGLAEGSTLHRVVLHVRVTDSGPGIPADHLPLLFEAYQQAENSITRRYGGTGLGLAISRALAQLMGGAVGVESTVGTGSTFWFTAVLEPARSVLPVSQPQEASSTPAQAAWQGLRVLVVDDNAINREVAGGMLQAMGLQAEFAHDGAQALARLQVLGPQYFSGVLMDVQMPQMDGLSATKALRQLPGFDSLPVIAMTAHTGLEDVAQALAAGMNAHLGKPLFESALQAVLQAWLGAEPKARSHGELRAASAPAADALPPVFEPAALDALAQHFPREKLLPLLQQFTGETLQRSQRLPQLAGAQDVALMRAEVHKLTGTAATFGLMRLGHLSAALGQALKTGADTAAVQALAQQVCACAAQGVEQLQAYVDGSD